MRAKVDPMVCIGCGICCKICPEVFLETGSGVEVKLDPIPYGYQKKCEKAAKECPLESITLEGSPIKQEHNYFYFS